MSAFFEVSYEETTTLLKQLQSTNILSWTTFLLDIRLMLNPANVDDYMRQGIPVIDSPFNDLLWKGERIGEAAQAIFHTLFLNVVPGLIDKLDTLEKADRLLNSDETIDWSNRSFRWLLYCPNKVYQLASSLLVAKAVSRANINDLKELYSAYVSDIEAGRQDVDFIRGTLIPSL